MTVQQLQQQIEAIAAWGEQHGWGKPSRRTTEDVRPWWLWARAGYEAEMREQVA